MMLGWLDTLFMGLFVLSMLQPCLELVRLDRRRRHVRSGADMRSVSTSGWVPPQHRYARDHRRARRRARREAANVSLSPLSVAATATAGAFVFLLSASRVVPAFFPSEDNVRDYANQSVSAYLSVCGLMYALVVAQILSTTSSRFIGIGQLLAEELAGVHRLVMLVAALRVGDGGEPLEREPQEQQEQQEPQEQQEQQERPSCATDDAKCDAKDIAALVPSLGGDQKRKLAAEPKNNNTTTEKGLNPREQRKAEIFGILGSYAMLLLETLADGGESPLEDDLALLYSSVPVIAEVASPDCPIQVEIASRALDSANEVARNCYKRAALERKGIGPGFFFLNVFLCNSMFLGVLLINTGSQALNITFCVTCVVLIGCTTFIVSDLNQPHRGVFRVDLTACHRLVDEIVDIRRVDDADEGADIEAAEPTAGLPADKGRNNDGVAATPVRAASWRSRRLSLGVERESASRLASTLAQDIQALRRLDRVAVPGGGGTGRGGLVTRRLSVGVGPFLKHGSKSWLRRGGGAEKNAGVQPASGSSRRRPDRVFVRSSPSEECLDGAAAPALDR